MRGYDFGLMIEKNSVNGWCWCSRRENVDGCARVKCGFCDAVERELLPQERVGVGRSCVMNQTVSRVVRWKDITLPVGQFLAIGFVSGSFLVHL